MVSTRSLSAFAFLLALFVVQGARAAPIVYEGAIDANGTVSGTLIGPLGCCLPDFAEGRDYWSFTGTAGNRVSIRGARLDGDLDLFFSLYTGTTSVDEFEYVLGTFGGMSFLVLADDDWGPNLPGPFADPELVDLTLPASGVYTVVVSSFGNGPECGACRYELSIRGNDPLTRIPEPEALALLASGALGGLALARRRGTALHCRKRPLPGWFCRRMISARAARSAIGCR